MKGSPSDMSVECLDPADFLLIAEKITGIEVEALARLPRSREWQQAPSVRTISVVGSGVEFHNHELGPPGFSVIDEAGLEPMARYVTAMLPDRPYGAGVYAEGRVHVEHWTPTDDGLRRGQFRSVTGVGDEFRMLNPPQSTAAGRLIRQSDVLGPHGMGTLTGLRVAIVGAGGTGSQAALAIGYLGVEDLLILDDDIVEESNLNRLVTAGYVDLGEC